MSGSHRPLPRLLVSVRSVQEAAAALSGGCDLLDLKEPSRGSLGRVDERVLQEVCSFVEGHPHALPVSAALGELAEWTRSRPEVKIPANVSYFKMGLSRAAPTWRSDWNAARKHVDTLTQGSHEWIAVHYADASAESPPFKDVLTEACSAGCRGLLIDTYAKGEGRLLNFITPSLLMEAREQAVSSGLLFAIAGSIRSVDLETLVEVAPDVIAVRGAVCRDSDRRSGLSAQAVGEFRREIARVFSPPGAPSATETASTPIVAI